VIVKHANPCGVAIAATLLEAYHKAFATDPSSAFGGIIAFNREVDAATVEAVSSQFLEVLIAPGYTPDALPVIARKANVRVLAVPHAAGHGGSAWDMKRVGGGMLLQTPDMRQSSPISSSLGAWRSTSNPTRSSIAPTAGRWGSAPGR